MAQISYEKRIELELRDGYDNESIYEFGKYGFVMSSQGDRTERGEVEWKYDLYDASLELVDTRSVYINKRFRSDETYIGRDHVHKLYKDRKGAFVIVTVNAATLEVTKQRDLFLKNPGFRTWPYWVIMPTSAPALKNRLTCFR